MFYKSFKYVFYFLFAVATHFVNFFFIMVKKNITDSRLNFGEQIIKDQSDCEGETGKKQSCWFTYC